MRYSTVDIQQAVIERLKDIFKDIKLKNAKGEIVGLQFFAQDTPEPEEDEPIEPFCLVKLTEGKFENFNYTREISLAVVFCVYNENADQNRLMHLIDIAFFDLAKNPNIGDAHLNLPIEWSFQVDVDTYPFQYAAMQLNLECAGVRIADNDLT